MKSSTPTPIRSRGLFFGPAAAIGLFFVALVCSAPQSAKADGDALAEEASTGEDVAGQDPAYSTEVHGYRVLATDETTGFAETIEVEEKAKTMETVSEAVSKSVGVQVKQTGGIGSYGEASIRGSTSAQVPVYLDGMLLNRAGGGMAAVDLGNLSLDIMESIEIYRGNAPILLGASGIGGAISLKTRSFERPCAETALSYGSWNTARWMLLRGDRVGDTKALAILSVQGSKGDFVFFNRNGTLFNTEDDTYERRTNNEHFLGSNLVKLDGRFGAWEWAIMNDFSAKRQGIAGVESISTEHAESHLLDDATILRFCGPVSKRVGGKVDAHYAVLREEFDDAHNEIGTGAQKLISRSHAVGADALVDAALGKHDLAVRIGLEYERYAFRELIADVEPNPSTRVRGEIGLQYDWHPWDAFHTVFGIVLEAHNSRFYGGKTIAVLEETEPRTVDSQFASPSFGMRLELVDGLALRANAGRFVRPPDLAELFGNRGSFEGNPDLEPEVGINADAGLSYLFAGSGPIDSLRVDAVWFASWVKDLIVNEQKSQQTFGPKNVDAADIMGAESSFRIGLAEFLLLQANYTYFRGINESEKPYHNGNRLPGCPQHQAYGRIEARKSYSDWGAAVWVDADYTGKHYLGLANMVEQPDRTLFGLGYRYERPEQGVTFTLEIKNLFDTITHRNENGDLEPVTDFMMWPLPGRTVLATVHWKM